MARTNLFVPFEEKEDAKDLGARWDPAARTWYVDGPDPVLFARWLTPPPEPPPRGEAILGIIEEGESPGYWASRFALVTGQHPCWKCKELTTVSAVLIGDHQEIDEEGEPPAEVADAALFTSIVALDAASAQLLSELSPWLRPGYSGTRDEVYLANHCQHCDAFQGAWFTDKPGEVFFPLDESDAAKLAVVWQESPISLRGSGSVSSWHDWLIER